MRDLFHRFLILDFQGFLRIVGDYIRNDVNLVAQVVERQHGFVEHQNGIIKAQVVGAGIRNVFDRPYHVVAEVTDSATGKWGKIRKAHGVESGHRGTKILYEIGGLPVPIALDQKRISAQERVPGDSFAAFDTLQQKSVRAVFLQLQESRHRRQKIGDDRLVHRNDIPLRLKLFDFFQAWLHNSHSPSPSGRGQARQPAGWRAE